MMQFFLRAALGLFLLVPIPGLSQKQAPRHFLNTEPILTFDGHNRDAITALSLSPDGQWALSGDEKGTIRFWNLSTGKERLDVFVAARIERLYFSPDGNRALVVARTWLPRILNLQTGNWESELSAQPARKGWTTAWGLLNGGAPRFRTSVLAAAFSPDGKWIATGHTDGEILLWDSKTGTVKNVIRLANPINTPDFETVVTSLAFHPSGQELYLSRAPGQIGTASVFLEGFEHSIKKTDGDYPLIALNSNATLLFIVFRDGKRAEICDASTGALLKSIQSSAPPQTSAFSPNGRFWAAGYEGKIVRVFDTSSNEIVATYLGRSVEAPGGDAISGIAISGKGIFSNEPRVLVASFDGTVSVWKLPAQGLP